MRIADPGGYALKGALRAAIVMPVAFALGEVALDNPDSGLFAAFGAIAFLVFVDFGGSTRARLAGYAGLTLAGAALIALGTLCSTPTALATGAMFAVSFAILFAGVLNGYVAAAQPAAILSFVLPLMVPADVAAIPERLVGWGIAAALSTAAVLLIWPQRPRSAVRAGAARAARALADLVEAVDPAARARADAAARLAIRTTRSDFVSMQHRPSGTGGRTAALARLIEDLSWVRHYAIAAEGTAAVPRNEARTAIGGRVPTALRDAAECLESGGPSDPVGSGSVGDELRRAHDDLARATLERIGDLAADGEAGEAEAARELDEDFRLRRLSYAAGEVATMARRAVGGRARGGLDVARERLSAARRLAHAHASMRSVCFRNSLRGALGLSLAVLVGQLADVQHGFWVVLGTMSVLRSSALSTGATIRAALLGTFVGIVVGGLFILAVDDNRTALWIMLPIATGLAAYAPRAVSFAAGQAGFSLVVLILFNLIDPSGWVVGLVRIEDVAIGAGASLVVGLLFWPRGAVAVLHRALGGAYTSAAALLDAALAALIARRPIPEREAEAAFDAGQILDACVRDCLSDRCGANAPITELALLMAGASRMREASQLLFAAHLPAPIEPVGPALPRALAAQRELEDEGRSRGGWYAGLGAALGNRLEPPAPEDPPPDAAGDVVILEGGGAGLPPGVYISWARHCLDALRDLEPPLAAAADVMRRP